MIYFYVHILEIEQQLLENLELFIKNDLLKIISLYCTITMYPIIIYLVDIK